MLPRTQMLGTKRNMDEHENRMIGTCLTGFALNAGINLPQSSISSNVWETAKALIFSATCFSKLFKSAA